MTEEQILEEIAKLPHDAQKRVHEVLGKLVSEEEPELKELIVEVLQARYESLKSGKTKGLTAEEFMGQARERLRERVEQSTDHSARC